MKLMALIVTLVLTSGLPLFRPPNHPPIAYDDHVTLLYHPVQVVDIPVLDNDVDPEGHSLRVTGLSVVEGAKAEIIDGKLVRVYLSPGSGSGGGSYGLLAHGGYLVSDSVGMDKAEWFVWYWPEIPP